MWYDADIDALMSRTASRPIPAGRILPGEALAFGLVLAVGAINVMGLLVNWTAALLLAFTVFFYVAVYTMWLKRRTPQNIVIGGAAGALPPLIGWAAATGGIGIEPLLMFLIIFLWTPPHFWALALCRRDEYARAQVPMLPVVAGVAHTTRQILLYSLLLFVAAIAPWLLGFAGAVYGAMALAASALLTAFAWHLHVRQGEEGVATRLFVFSILYLVIVFAALLLDHLIALGGAGAS
jgi:protoheme IX farnesyltransferase